jgi:hypothetical protein
VRQPFASLILSGDKRYEARTWYPKDPGWFLLHASSNLIARYMIEEEQWIAKAITNSPYGPEYRTWSRSAIIGAFEVTAVVHEPFARISKRDLSFCGNPVEGCLWKIGDVLPLQTPVTCHGKLGLFRPDHKVVTNVLDQLRKQHNFRFR